MNIFKGSGSDNTKKGGEAGLPGHEHKMDPKPQYIRENYVGAQKLKGKVAIITGADSGIGRAAAIHFAKESARAVVIAYLKEHKDAEETKSLVEAEGAQALIIAGDVGDEKHTQEIVNKTLQAFGQIDILVNNAAEQHVQHELSGITQEQLERTFRTNIFAYFFLAKAVLPHLNEGSVIINTTSVTAYKGHPMLLDYSSTKGAIVSFTRSLALQLAEKNIRVNGVAPGPIWTPLIPATFPDDKVEKFGSQVPLGRKGHPSDLGPCYVFLASEDSSYISGQILHPNGGTVINT